MSDKTMPDRTGADRHALVQPDRGQKAIDLELVDKAGFAAWAKALSAPARAAVEAQKFEGGGYETAIVPTAHGWSAIAGVANTASLSSWCLAKQIGRASCRERV